MALALPLVARAADFRSTSDPATVLYDAPSARAKPLYVYGRDVPVESLVASRAGRRSAMRQERSAGCRSESLADKRMVVVRAPGADVRAAADERAPVVFRADRDVLLEIAEPAASPAATATPGWVKVRHRDGQAGYVRLAQVFGF